MKYFILAFKNWNHFSGRANRSEYWYFVLFSTIVSIVLMFLDISLLNLDPYDPTQVGVLGGIYNILTIIPSLSLSIRRLHDVNKSGWSLLWIFTIIGGFYILYLHIIKGTDGDNKHGAPSEA